MLKKIGLIFIGLLVSLIILELSMQFAGFAILGYHNYKNNKTLKTKSQYTIMCLGESTTFGGYPNALQKILNQKYPNKFSVIDLGIPSTNLQNILRDLDLNIAKYKPDFAISMMGINNGFVTFDNDVRNIENKKYGSLKLYKLYNMIHRHLVSSFKIKEVYATNREEFNLEYAYELYLQKKYFDAEIFCKKIIEMSPNDNCAYAFLALLYYNHLDKRNIAYKIASNIIDTNKQVPAHWKKIMYEIAIVYNMNNEHNIESAKKYIEKIFNDDNVVFDGDLYGFIKNYITSEQKTKFLKKMFSVKELFDQYYGLLAIESMDKKDYKKAEEYFKKSEDFRLQYPNKQTYELYKLIIKKLTNNNIKVICMQYPVRSIASLKEMLKNEEDYNKIEFLSNEDNFKQALKEKKYNEIFSDRFAGDFGHYKQEGSVLIAENVVKSLDNLLN